MEISRRYRVNVGTSVKGIKTWDCTVEMSVARGEDEEELTAEQYQSIILKESDALVAGLDSRYPPPKD